MKQVSDVLWEIPPSYKPGMRVPARIYANRELLEAMDRIVFEQVTNVACLPGIIRYSYAMADAHWGYGFPIGGGAAFAGEDGALSRGGVGVAVHCGGGLLRANRGFGGGEARGRGLVGPSL